MGASAASALVGSILSTNQFSVHLHGRRYMVPRPPLLNKGDPSQPMNPGIKLLSISTVYRHPAVSYGYTVLDLLFRWNTASTFEVTVNGSMDLGSLSTCIPPTLPICKQGLYMRMTAISYERLVLQGFVVARYDHGDS
ncbi:uncharacterized protein EV420DRAFT_1643895 [Desarmillaria tabescens]|uniref:Uncharacterized protein n=1 Tax=Armillaria tabescens TaxID=1929756 RepID=A0AA39KAG4_ARMTA|nr:uncharacterized protein EV420DRAFT_1643895 [Desarmillaria tabescens]KAK0457567.1 hypothetical protein EV420DRAFT_1643895 [Desarmillaria tabescens]